MRSLEGYNKGFWSGENLKDVYMINYDTIDWIRFGH